MELDSSDISDGVRELPYCPDCSVVIRRTILSLVHDIPHDIENVDTMEESQSIVIYAHHREGDAKSWIITFEEILDSFETLVAEGNIDLNSKEIPYNFRYKDTTSHWFVGALLVRLFPDRVGFENGKVFVRF